jgi:hypothetical protein
MPDELREEFRSLGEELVTFSKHFDRLGHFGLVTPQS